MTIRKPTIIEAVQVAENDFVVVNMDRLEFPGGARRTHLKVTPKNGNGVVVVVVNQDNQLYVHRAYHYAADTIQTEFIRGFSDPNETDTESALRELKEEIAADYELMEPPKKLGMLFPDSTLLNSKVSAFLVRVKINSMKATQNDVEEALAMGQFVTQDELRKQIVAGQIQDGFTLAAFTLFSIQ